MSLDLRFIASLLRPSLGMTDLGRCKSCRNGRGSRLAQV